MKKSLLYRSFTILLIVSMFISGSAALASDKPWDGETLTFVSFLNQGGNAPREIAWQNIFDSFYEETGVTVEMQTVPWTEIDNQLVLSTQAGNPPDVSLVRYQNFARNVEAGALLPLDDFVARDFTDEQISTYLQWEKCGYMDGHKYCIPTSLLCLTLVGRKDLLEEAGIEIPDQWTWELFLDAAQKLRTEDRPAILLEGSPNQKTQLDWLQPIIESMGGQILDENGIAVFDQPAGVEAFQLMKDFIWTYGITPASTASLSTNEVIDNFTAGNAAFILLGSQRFSVQAAALGFDNLFIMQIPGNAAGEAAPTVTLPWMLGIPSNASNPELSWEFIKFFTSKAPQLNNLEIAGEIPCINSVLDDPIMDTEFGEVVTFLLDYIGTNSSQGVAPSTYNELADIVANALQEVLISEDSDVQAILTRACENYNAIR